MTTVEEIYDEITAAQAAEGALAEIDVSGDNAASIQQDVSNGSRVSRHRIIKWVIAYIMWVQRFLFELFKIETRELAREGHYGTKRWWVAASKRFQFGYEVQLTSKDFFYDVDDPSARIVPHCAVVDLGHKVVLKVARNSANGYTNLSQPQLVAYQAWAKKVGPPMIIEARTARPDNVRMYGTVVCDAMQNTNSIKVNVEAAVSDYLLTLNLDGVIRLTDVRRVVLEVPGVIDFVLNSLERAPWGSPNYINVARISYTFAGYSRIAEAFPLDETLNYVNSHV